MPASGKVSLTRQTIFCFIPIMDIYAAYHVKKLRWYLLIMLGVAAALSGMGAVINPFDEPVIYNEQFLTEDGQVDWGYAMFGDNVELGIAWLVISQAIVYAIVVFLIRRWSKKWNMQFDNKPNIVE